MSEEGWIGVDLDGTLAYYEPKQFPEIGPPIPLMLERVKGWLAEGKDVRIMTARVAEEKDSYWQERRIQDWCLEYLGIFLPVTATKDMDMIELWDDRAVGVVMNTGELK